MSKIILDVVVVTPWYPYAVHRCGRFVGAGISSILPLRGWTRLAGEHGTGRGERIPGQREDGMRNITTTGNE